MVPITSGVVRLVRGRSLEEYVRELSPGSGNLYEQLRKEILGLGDDVMEGLSGRWIVYKRKGLTGSFCAVQPRKKLDAMTVSIRVARDFSDPKGVAKKWRPLWAWFKANSVDEIAYASQLVRQAYNTLKKH